MLTIRPLPTEDEAGPIAHIYELVEQLDDGRVQAPVSDFLEKLRDKAADFYARFYKLDGRDFWSNPLWPPMGNWFKDIGTCWEVGDNDRVRFYGFRDGDRLVLVRGCKKRGKATPTKETTKCAKQERKYKAQNQSRGVP